MDVLLSTEITPDMLVSTTAPERLPGQVEWAPDTAYPVGTRVTRTATRRVYRAVYAVPDTVGPPEEDIATNQLPYWIDVGPMNKWAMFDGQVKTQTHNTGDLIVKLNPGPISSLWLGNMENAARAHIERRTGSGTLVFDETYELSSLVGDWEEYWFAPFLEQGDLPVNGIPSYNTGELTLTIESGGDVAVGMAALGNITNLGRTLWEPEADFRNWSARTLDTTRGPTEGTGGVATRDVTYSVIVEPQDAPRVTRFIEQAMGRPGVWIPHGDPRFEGIRVFGQAISARLQYLPGRCILHLTIRGFI